MIKNGLFLISIGFLIFVMGAVDANMRITFNAPLIFALIFIISGALVALTGHKKYKASKKEEEQLNESN